MNILVYTNFGLGDIIMATPAVSILYDAGHNITFLCEDTERGIIEENWIEVLTYSRFYQQAHLEQIKSSLKDRKFDVVLLTVPSNNSEGSFVFRPKECLLLHYEDEPQQRFSHHTVELNGWLAQKILNCNIHEYRLGKQRAINNCRNKDVLFHIGAQNSFWRYKAFPLDLYRQIMFFLKEQEFICKIIGDAKQRIYAQMFRGVAEDFTCIPLSSTKQLMLEAFAFVGNDCGPSHLASALYLPTISFFGPTRWDLTGAWPINVKRNRYIQATVPCSPCVRTKNIEICNNPICHSSVSFKDFDREWNEILKYRQECK